VAAPQSAETSMLAAGAKISRSIICDDVHIGAGTTIIDSFVAEGTHIAEKSRFSAGIYRQKR
jgi:ADP-glucose pyrophosphorylase